MANKICIRILIWFFVVIFIPPPGIIFGQNEIVSPVFKQEELDQMLAPVALYPDSLLVQILMAATYPIEVVEADRWAKTNRSLSGEQMTAALEQQNWDPSVKSLINFPSVLSMMNESLGWTQKLGDAFISQKDQVMETVQKLRNIAQTRGTLQSTTEQIVTNQEQSIVIESVNPGMVYVPVYDPLVVYGPWWYPAYPPFHCYPSRAAFTGNIGAFGFGTVLGAAWGYAWGGFRWNRREVFVNVNQNITINRNINRNFYANRIGNQGHNEWQHDPFHRKGVVYRNSYTANHFGQISRGNVNARRDYRGYASDYRAPISQSIVRPAMPGQREIIPAYDRQLSQQRKTNGAIHGTDQRGIEAKAQSNRGRSSQESMNMRRPPTTHINRNAGHPAINSAPRTGTGHGSSSVSHSNSGNRGHSGNRTEGSHSSAGRSGTSR